MSDEKALYDEDIVAWSKQQAEALRSAARGGSNQVLDWDNLAEEIEDLGKSQQSALSSQARRIIQHLLKLANSRAAAPRRAWRVSINSARVEIDYLLQKSPSLRTELAAAVADEMTRALRLALYELEDHSELDPAVQARMRSTVYSVDQVLGDWFPPGP